jgi:hypothetical protein
MVLGPLLFLIYINDLPKVYLTNPSPVLFTGDTSFIIANHNETGFKFKTSEIFNEINKWFHSNILMLNYDKTYFLQFLTKTDNELNMQVSFGNRKIATAQSLKFCLSRLLTGRSTNFIITGNNVPRQIIIHCSTHL